MRVMYCWELGGGLGHLARFAPWARELVARGVEIVYAFRDLAAAARIEGLPAGERIQGPVLLLGPLAPGFEPASYAEVLLYNGYGNVETLGALVQGWRSLIRLARADLIIADFAPTAMLAARLAGLPLVHLGDGYTIPPDSAAGASFGREAAQDPLRFTRADARVLACVNHVVDAAGAAPLSAIGDLQTASETILATYPELDHYWQAVRTSAFQGHFGAPRAAPGETARHAQVLAYLKPGAAHFEAITGLLARLPVRSLVYAGGLVRDGGAGADWSARPLDMDALIPGCNLVICHGGHGLVCEALLAGRPLLILPTAYEQVLTARNVERIGAGVWVHPANDARKLKRALDRCFDEPGLVAAAAKFSARHAQGLPQSTARLADHAGRLLSLAKRGAAA